MQLPCSGLARRFSFHSHLFSLSINRSVVDAQHLCRFGHAGRSLQDLSNVQFLEACRVKSNRQAGHWHLAHCGRPANPMAGCRFNHVVLRKDHRALNGVSQLAQIARPGITTNPGPVFPRKTPLHCGRIAMRNASDSGRQNASNRHAGFVARGISTAMTLSRKYRSSRKAPSIIRFFKSRLVAA